MSDTDEQEIARLARVAHEANRALQDDDGDECPSLPWACEDPATRALTARGVALARDGLSPAELHEAWCDGKRAQGWVYGETKDRILKTHPCLVPYDQLPEHQQVKDRVLRAIVTELIAQAHETEAAP